MTLELCASSMNTRSKGITTALACGPFAPNPDQIRPCDARERRSPQCAAPAIRAASQVDEESDVSQQAKPTIVFAHGLWADGSCYSKVIPRLLADGFQVISTQNHLNTV